MSATTAPGVLRLMTFEIVNSSLSTWSLTAVDEKTSFIASVLVIDPLDAHLRGQVEGAGMRCVVTPSVMSTPEIARRLAVTTLASVARPGQSVAE